MSARTFSSAAELIEAEGEHLGTGPWFEITQDLINSFAETTDDNQWIHVDPMRAASGPFGATVAHGFLTLSLIPTLGRSTFLIEGTTMSVNYGLERVRFPQPVVVGARVRARTDLKSVRSHPLGLLIAIDFVIDIEGAERPACVASTLRLIAF